MRRGAWSVLALLVLAGRAAGLVEIRNEFLRVIGHPESGRFVIKTTGGDPELATDDNKLLLYEEYPPTSSTVIRIDGRDVRFGSDAGSFTLPMTVKDNALVCVWTVGEVEVTQVLEFAKGLTTGRNDSVRISYAVLNKGSRPRKIGLRILLDTFLGRNDGAPFRVPGVGDITKETLFESVQVPDYWYAYDDLGEPSVRAQGTMRAEGLTPPDRVIFASWNRFERSLWDVAVSPERNFRRGGVGPLDSAVAMYWMPVEVAGGERIGVSTMYGLYGATLLKGEVFNLSLGGPNSTKGEPVTLTVDIQKTAIYPAREVSAELRLPEGLAFAEGETATKVVGEMVTNAKVVRLSWNVVPDGRVRGEVRYAVVVSGKVEEKVYTGRAERTLVIEEAPPPSPPPAETPPPARLATVTTVTEFDFSRIDAVVAAVNADIAAVNALIEEINRALAERGRAAVRAEDRRNRAERSAGLRRRAEEEYPALIRDASTNFRRVRNVTNR